MQTEPSKEREERSTGPLNSSPENLASKPLIGHSTEEGFAKQNLANSSKSEVAKPNPSLILDKLLFLEGEIAKIKAHIAKRKSLALAKTQLLNQEIARLEAELRALPQLQPPLWQPGINASIDAWKSERERRILSLKQDLWAIPEQLERDLVFLERELRELLREYLPLKALASLSTQEA